jgi:hypothetical protein
MERVGYSRAFLTKRSFGDRPYIRQPIVEFELCLYLDVYIVAIIYLN